MLPDTYRTSYLGQICNLLMLRSPFGEHGFITVDGASALVQCLSVIQRCPGISNSRYHHRFLQLVGGRYFACSTHGQSFSFSKSMSFTEEYCYILGVMCSVYH